MMMGPRIETVETSQGKHPLDAETATMGGWLACSLTSGHPHHMVTMGYLGSTHHILQHEQKISLVLLGQFTNCWSK